jgi:hypothetical protein
MTSALATSTELVLLQVIEQIKDTKAHMIIEKSMILETVQKQSFIQEFTDICYQGQEPATRELVTSTMVYCVPYVTDKHSSC